LIKTAGPIEIILFSDMLKFSDTNLFLKDFIFSFVKENEESFVIFWNVIFVEMKSSKLNNNLAKTW
jgi:hypothetical protein